MEQLKRKTLSVLSLAFVAALAAGAASANVTAKAESMNDFAITATSVRLDNPSNDYVDSGLRFKVDCPTSEVEAAYTVLTMTTAAGVYQTAQVDANVWRPDGSGWNTVVANIPDTDYVTEITAQAFVTVNGVTYETQAVTSSIAKTASLVLNAGYATEDQVGHYVAGQVDSITLDNATATMRNGASMQLNWAVEPAGYGVVWSSNDTGVATVDKDGNVKAVGVGEATITASMGGVSAACVVTVEQYFDGTFETVATSEVSHAVVYSSIKSVTVAQNPTNENGKALKLDVSAANDPYLQLNLSDAFVAQAEVGKRLSYKAYGIKGENVTGMLIKAKPSSGIATSVAGFMTGDAIIARSADGDRSPDWVQVDVILTEAMVNALKAEKCLTFILKMNVATSGQTKNATFYLDDIAINEAFDGTFETMSTSSVSIKQVYGTLPTVTVEQSPTDANGKALKVVTAAGSNQYMGITLPETLLANVAEGKVITYKVYAERANTNGVLITRFGSGTALFNGDAQAEVVAAGQTQSSGWVEIAVILTADQASAVKTNGYITFFFKTTASGTPTATYYVDDITIRDKTEFNGTFENMTTAELTLQKVHNNLPTAIVAQSPTNANGKALKVIKPAGSDVYMGVVVSEAFLANVAEGKTISYKVYAERTNTNGVLITRFGTSTALFNGDAQAEVVASGQTQSSDWVEISVTLTADQANKIKTNGYITFYFKTTASGSPTATFYVDDIVVK